jgi:hypothetical protein
MSPIEKQSEHTGPRRLALLVTALVFGVTTGCAENGPLSGAKLYPVKGKVTLSDGKPLTSGRIVFAATKSPVTSVANIENDGAFTFKGGTGDGLPEGGYKIRIEAGSSGRVVKGARGNSDATPPFDMKYLDEDASELTATVSPDESKNYFEIKLQKYDPAAQFRAGKGR